MSTHDVPLPIEFAELDGKIKYVRRKNSNEYSGTCPHCGGSPHPNGEIPDRFVMLINSRIGQPFGFCRKCGYKWWYEKDGDDSLNEETLRELERQSREYVKKRDEERRLRLAKFTTGELWRELNERMEDQQRQWWRDAGVPDDWQNYLRLGYIPEKVYEANGEYLKSPAYTIPYFHYGFTFKTMQYRLVADIGDRYRFEPGLETTYYMTTPNLNISDQVIICEGAKKGIVLRIRARMGTDKFTVLAVPSKADWRSNGILDAVDGCGRVYIVFDPDCWTPPIKCGKNWKPEPIKFAGAIGNAARIVELPVKLDDAFLLYGMDKDDWQSTLRHARRL